MKIGGARDVKRCANLNLWKSRDKEIPVTACAALRDAAVPLTEQVWKTSKKLL
jgi:hypothetical protein